MAGHGEDGARFVREIFQILQRDLVCISTTLMNVT